MKDDRKSSLNFNNEEASVNTKRRNFMLSGAIGVAGLMSGCVTRSLKENRTYTEAVSSVLITQDKQKIVFIGKEFHYIFDAPPSLVNALERAFHDKVSGALSNFHVNSSGTITGTYDLQLGKDASEKDRADAISAGFISQPSGQLSLQGRIQGTRYSAGNFPGNENSRKLNKTYNITVVAEQSNVEKGAKALLTPITMTADGVLILGAIVLAPIVLFILLTKH